MEAAGRDRRVRASPKVAPKVESKKVAKAKAKSRGKKRQSSQTFQMQVSQHRLPPLRQKGNTLIRVQRVLDGSVEDQQFLPEVLC